MRITSKSEFFRLWRAGVLGNRTNLWSQLEEIPYNIDDVGFRQIGKSGGGAWERVQGWHEIWKTFHRWKGLGRQFVMDDGCPDEHRVLQGEICRTYRGLEGFLDTTALLPMRPAVAAGHMRACSGATVLALLDRFMDASSRDDLDQLLDLYPDATVEFTCFKVDVGVFPNRNTLFWEVRNY